MSSRKKRHKKNNLIRFLKKISPPERAYFLQSLKDLETPKNLKKKAKSLKEIFETGGIVIFLIK